MTSDDIKTIDAMEAYGEAFEKELAKFCRFAGAKELPKIKNAWKETWQKYEEMGKRLT